MPTMNCTSPTKITNRMYTAQHFHLKGKRLFLALLMARSKYVVPFPIVSLKPVMYLFTALLELTLS